MKKGDLSDPIERAHYRKFATPARIAALRKDVRDAEQEAANRAAGKPAKLWPSYADPVAHATRNLQRWESLANDV